MALINVKIFIKRKKIKIRIGECTKQTNKPTEHLLSTDTPDPTPSPRAASSLCDLRHVTPTPLLSLPPLNLISAGSNSLNPASLPSRSGLQQRVAEASKDGILWSPYSLAPWSTLSSTGSSPSPGISLSCRAALCSYPIWVFVFWFVEFQNFWCFGWGEFVFWMWIGGKFWSFVRLMRERFEIWLWFFFFFVVGRYKWRCSSFESGIAACFECHDSESREIGDIGLFSDRSLTVHYCSRGSLINWGNVKMRFLVVFILIVFSVLIIIFVSINVVF